MGAESLLRGGAADPGYQAPSLLAKRRRFFRDGLQAARCPLSVTVAADGTVVLGVPAANKIDPCLLPGPASEVTACLVCVASPRYETGTLIGRHDLQ